MQHNQVYVLTAVIGGLLYNEMHVFHTSTMLVASSHNIYPCGIDTAVTENIGKLGDILFDTVKGVCE